MTDVRPPNLYAFTDTLPLARSVGEALGVQVVPIRTHRFPDGESLVCARRGESDRALVFRSLHNPNEKLVELMLVADALRRQGLQRIGLVAPYLAYMRQDKAFHAGEPVSQRVVAGMIDDHFDELFTVEPHLHRIRRLDEVFRCDATALSAAGPIADWLLAHGHADVLIGPDEESEPWVRSIAEQAGCPHRIGSKTRRADRDVEIDLPELPAGALSAWIVDDIASTGVTLEAIVRLLRSRGVEEIGAIVVHPLMDAETPARLEAAGLDHLVSTDSIEHPSNAIGLGPLIAERVSKPGRRLEAC